jgi:predicted MFS family arabinose efflux permease
MHHARALHAAGAAHTWRCRALADNAGMPSVDDAVPAAAQRAGSARVPVAAIAALSFAAFASAASLRVTDPSLTRIAAEFDVTLAAASYAITAFSLAYGLCQIVFGPAGDRFGKVRVVAWVCVLSTLAALACAWSPTYATLLAARAIAGAAAAAVVPLAMAWIGDVIPYAERQPVLARFLTGQILGVACGGLIGGVAADHFGWRTAFVVIAAWFAIAAALLARVQRALPPSLLVPPVPGRSAIAHMATSMREVAAHRWPRVILATVFLEGATLFGAFAFVATHVHDRYGLSLTLSGGVTLLFGLGGLVFAIAARPLVSRLGEVRLPVAGALLLGASFVLVGAVPSPWLALPCMIAAGLGFYMLHNSLQTQATQMAPERRGAAVSLFAFCYFLGQSVGVALAGWLLHFVSTGVVIALGGVLVTIVGLRYARLRAARDAAAGGT